MNRRAYIFCLSVLLLGFTLSFVCGTKMGSKKSKTISNKVETQASTTDSSMNKKTGYWVKLKGNTVFVYKYDGYTLVSETGIDVEHLTTRERRILENGVYLETKQELFNFLESSTS